MDGQSALDVLITILSLLGVIILLVMAHECGHYFTARAFKVKVEEFGLFFPPRLWSFKRGETRYSINAIPIGGFVKLAGEEDPSVPGSLAGRKPYVRILVLAAGSVMNALLPLVLFSLAFMIPHNVAVGQVVVEEVAADSPAEQAGIEAGDTIIMMNGNTIQNIGDIQTEIQLKLGQELEMVVEHSDATRETVRVVPRWRPPEGEGAVGVLTRLTDATIVSESYPFWEAIPMGFAECIDTYILYKNGIISLIIGEGVAAVTGPVGIAELTGEAARAGFSYLLQFAAFFSINLAIINLFPLPALDGGRIAFVLLEWIRRGKRISARVEGLIHTAGFFLLMAAMLAITYQDIARIIAGESLIP
jgi:regulator of sigma E protease